MKTILIRVRATAIGLGFVGLLVLAIVTLTGTPAVGQTTVIYGKAADSTSLDPHMNGVNRENSVVTKSMSESFVFRDSDDKIVPWLARSWEVSDDYKTWVFHFRKDVKFHDGEPFNAEAVCFTLERVLNGKGGQHTLLRLWK